MKVHYWLEVEPITRKRVADGVVQHSGALLRVFDGPKRNILEVAVSFPDDLDRLILELAAIRGRCASPPTAPEGTES